MIQPYTRTNLLCRDCRYNPDGQFDLTAFGIHAPCGHEQATYMDPVNGKTERMTCREMRASEKCGYAGALWEPKPDQAGV
jgi:hypothetical protein